jgi:hypothetical protein
MKLAVKAIREAQIPAPDGSRPPSFSERGTLSNLFMHLGYSRVIQLFASLLCERRIVVGGRGRRAAAAVGAHSPPAQFTSSDVGTLTAACHACNLLVFPLRWQYVFIPVLPEQLLDYCG